MRMQRQLPILTARAVVAPSHSQDNPTERNLKHDAKIEPLAKAVWRKTMKADNNKSTSIDPSEVEHLGKGREVSVTITINVEEGKIRTKGSKTNNDRSERKRKGSSSESEKEEDDEKRKKRRRSTDNEDGLSRFARSGYHCECLCGCSAKWKERVRCVICRRYLTGNINACQCCIIIHPETDAAMCHMCHNEEYAASSGLEVRKPQEEASEGVRKANDKRWREGLASTGTHASRWSQKQHRPTPEGVEGDTAVAATKRHVEDGTLIH